MVQRTHDWFRQAERDLAKVTADIEGAFYEWACFTAQQSAEKAVQALVQHLHGETRGHSVLKILRSVDSIVAVPSDVLEAAMLLDSYYVLTRYPNGWTAGSPMDYFSEARAIEARRAAKKVVEYVRNIVY